MKKKIVIAIFMCGSVDGNHRLWKQYGICQDNHMTQTDKKEDSKSRKFRKIQ